MWKYFLLSLAAIVSGALLTDRDRVDGSITMSNCSFEGQLSSCKVCLHGSYANGNSTNCTCCGLAGQCPELYFCVRCQHGHYQPERGGTSCRPCPEGYFQNMTGQGSCRPCTPGTYCNTTACIVCSPCPIGHFSSESRSKRCIPCPVGFYQSYSGKEKCQKCPLGYETKESGQTMCVKCPIGYFKNSDMNVCQPCPPGHEATSEGTPLCSACRPGSFKGEANERQCQPCEHGYYVIPEGATMCHRCPAGFYCPCRSCQPVLCPKSAVCPAGSTKPISCKSPFFVHHDYQCYISDALVGIIIGCILILTILVAILAFRVYFKPPQRPRTTESSSLVRESFSEPVYTGL